MKLFSKWRAQKRESAASQVTSRSQDVVDETSEQAQEQEQEQEMDGPMSAMACCATPTVDLEAAGETPTNTTQEGGVDDSYHPFDEGNKNAKQPTPTQVDNHQQKRQQPNVQVSNGPEEQPQQQQHVMKELFLLLRQRSWKKKLLTFLVVVTITPVFLDLFLLRTGHVTDFIDACLEWTSGHPLLGVWAHVCLLTLASLIFVPPSILIFAAGFTFQALWGSWGILIALVSSFMGSAAGGLVGFWRANYMTRDFVEVLMRRYPLIQAVDAAIVRNPLRVMLLLRLNCLIPFGVLNYVFGISGVQWEEFLLAMAGIVPWQLLLIFLGASAETMYDEETDTTLMGVILMATGVAFGIIGLAIMWKFAKKELQKSVDATAPSNAAGYRVHDPDARPWRSRPRKAPAPSVEDADMDATDYFYTLCLGGHRHENHATALVVDDGPRRDDEDYDQSNLTWSEIILDDFS